MSVLQIELDLNLLFRIVLVVSIETIGVVQFLKNFIKPKHKNGYSIVSLFIILLCSFIHSVHNRWVPYILFDLVMLSLALTQTAWDTIVKALPNLVNRVISGMVSDKSSENASNN